MTPILSTLVVIVVVWLVVALFVWGVAAIGLDAQIARIIRVILIVAAGIWTLIMLLRVAGVAVPGLG